MPELPCECSPETGDTRAQQTELGQEQDAQLQQGHGRSDAGNKLYLSF